MELKEILKQIRDREIWLGDKFITVEDLVNLVREDVLKDLREGLSKIKD